MWSRHEQQTWQVVKKHVAHPGRHAVRAWGLEVPVDDDNCDEDCDNVHDEGKEQVLGNERDLYGGGRQDHVTVTMTMTMTMTVTMTMTMTMTVTVTMTVTMTEVGGRIL